MEPLYSVASNPNGVWQYGYTNTLGSSFILDTIQVTGTDGSGTGFQDWEGNLPGAYGFHYPRILKHDNYTPLGMHPGPNGEYSDLRWTAPMAGTFMLNTLFQGADPAGVTTDFHLLKNGVSLFSGNINGYPDTQVYNDTISFAQGDILDVAVGFGSNGNYSSDTTGVSLRLSAPFSVPEPGTLSLLLAGGVAGAGVLLRRRRK